jgi:hypothetical protein
VNQLQGLHAEQLKQYLHADRMLAVEMATIESEVQASQVFQFHPNVDLEAKKLAYFQLQQVLNLQPYIFIWKLVSLTCCFTE